MPAQILIRGVLYTVQCADLFVLFFFAGSIPALIFNFFRFVFFCGMAWTARTMLKISGDDVIWSLLADSSPQPY